MTPKPTECTYCGLSFAHEHVEGGTPKEFFMIQEPKQEEWTLEYCPRCNQMTNHSDRCKKCGFVDVIGVDLSGTESVRNIKESDTIAIPVSWLKELVELSDEQKEGLKKNLVGFVYSPKYLIKHIDLIREKIK